MEHSVYWYEGEAPIEELVTDVAERFACTPETRTYESFGIDDARSLTLTASLRTEGKRIFVVSVGQITTEAQQALLKLFEEPAPGVHFVVMLPYGALLPTLRSRGVAYPERLPFDSKLIEQAEQFLHATSAERSKHIAALLKNEDTAKAEARRLVEALLRAVLAKPYSPARQEALLDISLAERYLGDRSASLKMLLEHLAVALDTF